VWRSILGKNDTRLIEDDLPGKHFSTVFRGGPDKGGGRIIISFVGNDGPRPPRDLGYQVSFLAQLLVPHRGELTSFKCRASMRLFSSPH